MRALHARLFRLSLMSASLAAVAAGSTPAAAQAEVREFDIPAQSLSSALLEFSRQSDVFVVVAPELTEGKRSPTLRALLPVNEAINRLLKGSGLRAVPNPRGGYRIERYSTAENHAVQTITQAVVANPTGSDVSGSERGTSDGSYLEDIVVTAQRREEKLQNVPISAQVISNRVLTEQNFNSLSELTQITPGVHVSTGTNSNQMFIRGIGSGNNPSFDQSVASFVDGIYRGRSRSSEALFLDIDRIEILKGPQTTFFGNSAIAGALNIVTKNPSDRFEASGRLLYGEFDQYAAEAAVGGPITSGFGARLAVSATGGNGWIYNENTRKKVPETDSRAARLTLLFQPTEDLDATLKVEGAKTKVKGTAFGLPPQWANCPASAPIGANYPGLECALALTLGVPTGLENNRTSGLPGQGYRYSGFGTVFTVNYHKWGHVFTSVTGFNKYKFPNEADPLGLPIPVITTSNAEKYHQFSQEFRITSPSDQSVEYLAGLYYQSDKLETNTGSNLPGLNALWPLFGLDVLIPYLPIALTTVSKQHEYVYSAFGALSWQVTDRLKLNGGLRGTRVKKRFEGSTSYGTGTELYPPAFVPLPSALQPLPGLVFGPPGSTDQNQSSKGLMASVGVQYDVTPNAMVYATFNRGFKAGGFNGLSQYVPDNPSSIAYGPEHVNAYELGIKSKWFDGSVLMNVALFRSDYRDLQVSSLVLIPATGLYRLEVENAARSRSQGVEFEAQWAASRNLRVSTNVTYLDARYVSYPNAPQTTLQTFCAANYVLPECGVYSNPVPAFSDRAGQRMDYSPRWSGSLTVNYSTPFLDDYKITTEVTSFFSTSYNDQDPYLPGTDGYVRFDGRLSLETSDGRWALDVIGKNLTDKTIRAAMITQTLFSKQPPRSVAVQVRYRY